MDPAPTTTKLRTPAALACTGLSVGYARPVLAGLDLSLAPGETLALLGSSGSGKTTLLNTIAGFVAPLAGQVWLAGQLASGPGRLVPPERRRVGMVFQDHALWPHLSVLDTVAYPLRRSGTPKAAARRAAHDILTHMGLAPLAERRPGQLSGGEQQRVGLARALAGAPGLYLFDEPTAHLDASLRAQILDEVARRRAADDAAAIYATHDATEALAIADRVAVLHSGRLAQAGPPAELYAAPADLTVARLTGPVSVLHAPVHPAAPGHYTIHIAGTPTTVPGTAAPTQSPASQDSVPSEASAVAQTAAANQAPAAAASAADSMPATGSRSAASSASVPGSGSSVILVRPDWARLARPDDPDDPALLPGTLTEVRFRGPHTDYHLTTPAGPLLIREPGPPHATPGPLRWSLLHLRLLPDS